MYMMMIKLPIWVLLPIAVTIPLMSASFGELNPKLEKKPYSNVITTDGGYNAINNFDRSTIFTEVHFDGPMPRYKKDTVEYNVADYVAIPNESVERIVKRMVEFELDGKKSISFQGQLIKKAKLNGRDFGGANLYNAIKTLSADTIEKLFVVNNYNNHSAQPDKFEYVLNLITYSDKKAAKAAKRTISGIVMDKKGMILIGAKVRIYGTFKKDVETGSDGKFKIDVPRGKDFLAADYVGYSHQHIRIGKQNKLNITLVTY